MTYTANLTDGTSVAKVNVPAFSVSEPIDVETSPQRGLSTVIDIIVVVISQPHPQFPSGCGLRRAVARRNSGAMPSR